MISLEILLPLLCLILFSTVARVTLGSWLAPGAFFPLFWMGLIAISLPIEEYPLWPPALWWILGTLLVFYLGSLLGGGRSVRSRQLSAASEREIQFTGLTILVLICSGCGVLYILTREFFAPRIIDKPPAFFQILLGGMWAAPMFGGMLLASNSSKRGKWIGIVPLAVTVLYAVAYVGRSPILAGLYFWSAGFWSVRLWRTGGGMPLFTKKMVVAVPILLITLAIAGATIQAMRKDNNGLPLEERFGKYGDVLESTNPLDAWFSFRHGLLSHPYAFSYYLQRAIDRPPQPLMGAKTFAGLLDLVGWQERIPFDTFEVDPGIESNVYSAFMPPIEDFGLVGSFLAFLVAGIIAGWGYARVVQGKLRFAPILNMFYPHVLIVGGYFFAYNSMTLAHLMVAAYLLWLHFRGERRVAAAPVLQASRNRPLGGLISQTAVLGVSINDLGRANYRGNSRRPVHR